MPARARGLRAQLIRGGTGSLVVRVFQVGFGFLAAVVLARTLGPDGYGVYAFVLALVTVLSLPAQAGLPTLVVRETARAQAERQWGLIRALWRWSSVAAGAITLSTAVLAIGIVWAFADFFNDAQIRTLMFGVLLVPLIALGNLRGAALQGLRRVVIGQLPEAVLRPGLFLALVAGAVLMRPAAPLTATQAMALHALAASAAFSAGALMLWRARPEPLKYAAQPVYLTGQWIAALIPLAMLAGLRTINQHADILLIGVFMTAQDVGVYRVAVQGAALGALGQHAVNMVVAPHVAFLHASGDTGRLQGLATTAARASLAAGATTAVAFTVFGGPILDAVFGADYTEGRVALTILASGYAINAAIGSAGFILNMTGHERETARTGAVASAVNIALNLVLIPRFGISGAALATAVSTVAWHAMLWRIARLRLGIDSSAIGQAGLTGSP